MNSIIPMLRNELRLLIFSPSTYAASVIFTALMSFFYLFGIEDVARFTREMSPLEAFLHNFWLPVLFMVPMLTMRSFSEERRQGTLLTLLSTPTPPFVIVLSKFFAAYLLYLLLWASTLVFPYIAGSVSSNIIHHADLLNPSKLLGGYSFIALSGCFYVSIGVFASSLSRSQLIAGMTTFCCLFLVIILGQLLNTLPHSYFGSDEASISSIIHYVHTFLHLEDFSSGTIDTRPICYYLSNTLLLLGLTTLIIEVKP